MINFKSLHVVSILCSCSRDIVVIRSEQFHVKPIILYIDYVVRLLFEMFLGLPLIEDFCQFLLS